MNILTSAEQSAIDYLSRVIRSIRNNTHSITSADTYKDILEMVATEIDEEVYSLEEDTKVAANA